MLNTIESERLADNPGPRTFGTDPEVRPDSAALPHRKPVTRTRLERAKRSYATTRIDLGQAAQLQTRGTAPKAGDLVLARVTKLGHHKRIESPAGRRANLFVGDEVLLCYGARYASDQFEALVPEDLGDCHMVAAGGIAARCINRHESSRAPTRITPIGLVMDCWGRVLNLGQFARSGVSTASPSPLSVAVLGTSMNSGKTTTAAAIVRGLANRGYTVGAVKVTGTGAGCDRWAYVDAGAHQVMDFTDFGYASTYQVPVTETAAVLESALSLLAEEGCDVVVVEVADGLFFSETAELVSSPVFRDRIDGVMLAASDAMGAVAGRTWLQQTALDLWAVGGRFTSSPLAVREARSALSEPIVSLEELDRGDWIPEFVTQRVAICP